MTRREWLAGPDGVAHLVRPGWALAACGARAVDPRWAWPARERCEPCVLSATWGVAVRPASRRSP